MLGLGLHVSRAHQQQHQPPQWDSFSADEFYVTGAKYGKGHDARTTSMWVMTCTRTVAPGAGPIECCAFPVPDRKSETCTALIGAFVRADGSSVVYTDSWRGYSQLHLVCRHGAVNHQRAYRSRTGVNTNAAEATNGALRAIIGRLFNGFGADLFDLQVRLAVGCAFFKQRTALLRFRALSAGVFGDNLRFLSPASLRCLGKSNPRLLPLRAAEPQFSIDERLVVETDGSALPFLPPGALLRPDLLISCADATTKSVFALVRKSLTDAAAEGRNYVGFFVPHADIRTRIIAYTRYRIEQRRLAAAKAIVPDRADVMNNEQLNSIAVGLRIGPARVPSEPRVPAANVLLPVIIVGINDVGRDIGQHEARARFEASFTACANEVQRVEQERDGGRNLTALEQRKLAIDKLHLAAARRTLQETALGVAEEHYGVAWNAMTEADRREILRSMSEAMLMTVSVLDAAGQTESAEMQRDQSETAGQSLDAVLGKEPKAKEKGRRKQKQQQQQEQSSVQVLADVSAGSQRFMQQAVADKKAASNIKSLAKRKQVLQEQLSQEKMLPVTHEELLDDEPFSRRWQRTQKLATLRSGADDAASRAAPAITPSRAAAAAAARQDDEHAYNEMCQSLLFPSAQPASPKSGGKTPLRVIGVLDQHGRTPEQSFSAALTSGRSVAAPADVADTLRGMCDGDSSIVTPQQQIRPPGVRASAAPNSNRHADAQRHRVATDDYNRRVADVVPRAGEFGAWVQRPAKPSMVTLERWFGRTRTQALDVQLADSQNSHADYPDKKPEFALRQLNDDLQQQLASLAPSLGYVLEAFGNTRGAPLPLGGSTTLISAATLMLNALYTPWPTQFAVFSLDETALLARFLRGEASQGAHAAAAVSALLRRAGVSALSERADAARSSLTERLHAMLHRTRLVLFVRATDLLGGVAAPNEPAIVFLHEITDGNVQRAVAGQLAVAVTHDNVHDGNSAHFLNGQRIDQLFRAAEQIAMLLRGVSTLAERTELATHTACFTLATYETQAQIAAHLARLVDIERRCKAGGEQQAAVMQNPEERFIAGRLIEMMPYAQLAQQHHALLEAINVAAFLCTGRRGRLTYQALQNAWWCMLPDLMQPREMATPQQLFNVLLHALAPHPVAEPEETQVDESGK